VIATGRTAAWAWLAVGAAGFAVLPWYAQTDGLLSFGWWVNWAGSAAAPALLQSTLHHRGWLAPLGVLLVVAALLATRVSKRDAHADAMIAIGAIGMLYLLAQGFAIGSSGWTHPWFASIFGPLPVGQGGVGLGAACVGAAFAMLFALGLADRGLFDGDGFVAGVFVAVVGLIALFTFYPTARILITAVLDEHGAFSAASAFNRLFGERVWGLSCITGGARCGVAWNTLFLGLACACACTLLGLASALIVSRAGLGRARALRVLTVLPIITPPFVLGLGIILLFGRSGLVNHLLEWAFHIEPGRWIYGMPGVLLAQVFAFTPIAFLVLVGVVEGIAPSLEEAAQTLRANRWRVFAGVSLPLMRPGLANAFLVCFIESLADFGNPILLGGNFGVLATEIFFSVVGAQLDEGRAAMLGIVLLAFALGAFVAQRKALGRAVYTTIGGKGDSGRPALLPVGVNRIALALVVPWTALTIAIYAIALLGGFAETWGRDYTPTLRHYARAFGVEWTANGLLFVGAAWSSFWTTLELAVVSAPITAALGILSAYLLTRQRFIGRGAFEFATMLSFAIPGTVIGVSYILAFNVPPIEITGTAIVLIACFVFRNMPVGVRAGIAAMSQIDRSLDEASTMLRARGFGTLRRVILPLLKPAIVAALVYSFVRAVTTVSAVIFLVSAHYELATTYIINRVINGDYGVAIAYCTVLIVLMQIAIGLIQWLVGRRGLAQRSMTPPRLVAGVGTA